MSAIIVVLILISWLIFLAIAVILYAAIPTFLHGDEKRSQVARAYFLYALCALSLGLFLLDLYGGGTASCLRSPFVAFPFSSLEEPQSPRLLLFDLM